MNLGLNVLVYSDENSAQSTISDILNNAEHTVTCADKTQTLLLKAVEASQPDALVIVLDSDTQNTATCLKSLATIHQLSPVPIVVFDDVFNVSVMSQLIASGVSAYVSGELEWTRVAEILTTAHARFKRSHALEAELVRTKEALASRKWVDQAKALLIEQRGMSEADAYATIRKMAMDSGQKIEDIAKNIVEMSHLWFSQELASKNTQQTG